LTDPESLLILAWPQRGAAENERWIGSGEGTMRRFVAVCALAGVAFLAPSVALAEPPLTAAQRLCEAQGGDFQAGPPPFGAIYSCDHFGELEDFTQTQLNTAERLCLNAYKGISFDLTAPKRYSCRSSV
jgi:hypothetical protein